MRAVAEYMMGRTRDAHNDLAGPGFDADRHAAFWRGLIEAKTEDWKNVHACWFAWNSRSWSGVSFAFLRCSYE